MTRNPRRGTTIRPVEYFTPKEAAGYFGCTAECVKLWLYAGKLKGTKAANGYWYIKQSDLAKELEARGLPVRMLSKRSARKYTMKPVEINREAAK
ncbi:MAG: hypothetical protein L6R28_25750, partial [Planctomycetes bacterium]|nr:hypothetical protein [Planctomycetota bacterium]